MMIATSSKVALIGVALLVGTDAAAIGPGPTEARTAGSFTISGGTSTTVAGMASAAAADLDVQGTSTDGGFGSLHLSVAVNAEAAPAHVVASPSPPSATVSAALSARTGVLIEELEVFTAGAWSTDEGAGTVHDAVLEGGLAGHLVRGRDGVLAVEAALRYHAVKSTWAHATAEDCDEVTGAARLRFGVGRVERDDESDRVLEASLGFEYGAEGDYEAELLRVPVEGRLRIPLSDEVRLVFSGSWIPRLAPARRFLVDGETLAFGRSSAALDFALEIGL